MHVLSSSITQGLGKEMINSGPFGFYDFLALEQLFLSK